MPVGDSRKAELNAPSSLSSDQTIKTHTKFALDVRYSPSGNHFASVGSDGKVFLYDGKVGDSLGEFSESHTGTAVSQLNATFVHDRKKFSRVLVAGHSMR
jgi:WD40 repeat protein